MHAAIYLIRKWTGLLNSLIPLIKAGAGLLTAISTLMSASILLWHIFHG